MIPILECLHLTKRFGAVVAVDDAHLAVESGEFVTLLGPSGCGKSTTLRLIAGFERPDGGAISLNGRRIANGRVFIPPEERHIGMVFQDYALFPHLNVADNVAFGLRGNRKDKRARAAEMLDLVGLGGLGERMPYELSGGQQQRVALARALAPAPDLVLLDEPFSNLDAALRAQVRGEVRAILKQARTTCIFVTHDQEEALSLSDRVAVMFDGRIVQIDRPSAVYRRPVDRRVASFVGEANYLPATADGDRAACLLGDVALVEPVYGAVTLMLRPEALTLTTGGGQRGTVIQHAYYGHDQRVIVRLDDGGDLIVRLGAFDDCAVGDAVGVQVSGEGVPLVEHPT